MVTIRTKALFLSACFIEAIWLLVAQTLGSMVLLLPCLVCFLAMTAWAAFQNIALPVLLFFLPFAPLLKLMPDTISFYTVSLLLVYAIYAIRGSRNMRVHHLVPALALIALTLTVKILSGFEMSNTYILFCASLLLVPFVAAEMDGRYDFYWMTVFFVLGVLFSALTAYFLADSSSIARYINVVYELGLYRQSGYYSDPNFYSAHITAALGAVLVSALNYTDRVKRVLLVLMTVLLLYCGLLSISKSFLLISLCLFIGWFLVFMFQKGRISAKILMILIVLLIAAFILSSTVFTDLMGLMLSRFSDNNNLSDFTTNRTDLWANYLQVFREEPLVLLFGNGYSKVLVEGRTPHNTVFQSVFQLGLVGTGLLIAWFVCLARVLVGNNRGRRPDWAQVIILLVGTFGPWMGLDYLFFDELFLFPVYACVAVRLLGASSVSAAE